MFNCHYIYTSIMINKSTLFVNGGTIRVVGSNYVCVALATHELLLDGLVGDLLLALSEYGARCSREVPEIRLRTPFIFNTTFFLLVYDGVRDEDLSGHVQGVF